jgi:hypothetical protein
MNSNAKLIKKIDNLISMIERIPEDKVIMVPQETIDALAELAKQCPTDCDTESEEDSDWDGDLDDTPNCHQCGEDCGRSIIAHEKYKKTYFCSEECNNEYDK